MDSTEHLHINEIVMDPDDDMYIETPLMSSNGKNSERSFPEHGIVITLD